MGNSKRQKKIEREERKLFDLLAFEEAKSALECFLLKII